jgi:cobalt-zinc-cadmium resistance protein CzcA
MKELIERLIRSRAVIVGLIIAYVTAGVMAVRNLPIEAYPDVTNIQAQVITLWPGHAAEEIEKFVTIPVENQMNGLPQRASLRSISMFGLSVVTITFEDDADNYKARSLVSQQMAQIQFPTGAQASLSSDSTAVGEIFRYTLQAPPDYPLTELRSLEDWVVERQFRTVPGVVDVVGFGGPTKQYQVLIDPVRLKSYNITLQQIVQALQNSNQNAGGAYIEHGSQMFIVRGLGLIQTLDDIRDTVLTVRNNTPIKVGDLGEVVVGNQLRLGLVGMNKPHPGMSPEQTDQDDVVQGIVLLRKGDNVLEVLKRVEEKAEQINRTYLPANVRLVPHYDRTELISRATHNVLHNVTEGMLLVLVVLVAFLGIKNWRSALIVASVVPLALLGAAMLLDYQKIPANLISMGAIDFGIIVDASVVIMENVIRLVEQRKKLGLTLSQCIVQGVAEMTRPIIFSKIVLLIAFVPLFTLQRVEGRIFKPMALTLSFAIVSGALLALVAVPCFASYFLRAKDSKESKEGDSKFGFGLVRAIRRLYLPLLSLALRLRLATVLVAAGLVAGALLLGSRLGSEFLPDLEEGALWVHMDMPESISPTEAAKLTKKERLVFASFPEVKTVVSQIGRPDDGTDVGGFNMVETYVELIPQEQWKTARTREELTAIMNDRLQREIPGADFLFSQYIEDNVNEAISGIKGEIGIKIFGSEPETLQKLADQIAGILKEVPGAADVGPETLAGQPQVQARVDRKAVARYGLGIGDVDSLVQTAFGGTVATQILEGERSFDLAVKLRPQSIANLDEMRAIPLFGANNEIITLGQVADVQASSGFARIYREENERRIAVKFAVRGRDLGSVIDEAQRLVGQKVQIPRGYRLEWTGSFENEQRAVKRLAFIIPVTIVAIFFVLFVAFNSPLRVIIILLNVPLAAIGGIIGLGVAALPVSVSAMVGFVALFGIAIQYGVIMLERVRELEMADPQISVFDVAKEAALSRLRPILMTSMMAALGLLPAALSHAVGAETARPFAVVIVGGLVCVTPLTLLVLPVAMTFLLPLTRRKPAAVPALAT